MALDIHTAVQAAIVLAILGILFSVWAGINAIRNAHNLKFFRMRRDRMVRGWRLLFFALILGFLIVFLNNYAEPIAYSYFPPTPTITLTPTVTLTPTITLTPTVSLTPTITLTPAVSNTPTITATPRIPLAIETRFEGVVTPNPDAIFSDLVFTEGIDEETYEPLNPGEVFENPLGHMYALFSYDGMLDGSQWTAIWYRNGELVHWESQPWDGGTGGLGYTDWDAQPSDWQPGDYEVQIFVGVQWKVAGTFTVEGEAPTPVASPSATITPSMTGTPPSTATPSPTLTPLVSPTNTTPATQTWTPWPTATPLTPTVTWTPFPTATPVTLTPTITRHPTFTPTVTPNS